MAAGTAFLDRAFHFASACRLAEGLLAVKRDLELSGRLRNVNHFDLLLLGDLGYLQRGNQESEVLFTRIAERYGPRSLSTMSNVVISR